MEHMGTNFSSIISGLKSGNNLSSVRRELFSHLHPLYDKIDKVNALTLHSFDRIGRQSTNVATYSNGSYVAFLEEALSLIPKLLKMSSCSDDTLITIFDMFNLCICCLEAVSPPEHNTFDFRGIYNHWKKYEEAKLEGMQLLESRGINFGGPAIPERGREDDILILTISVSVFKSVVLGRSPDENDYHRLLTILDKIRPRFRSITDGLTNEKMFAVYLSKCALIMVEEVARYDGSTALALCEKVFLNFQNLSMNDGLKKFGRQICDLVLSHWDHDDEPPLYSLDILIYVVDAMAKRCKSDDENSRLAFLELVEYCVIKCPFQVVVHLVKKEFLAKVEEQFYKEKIQPLGYITSFYVSGLLVESTLVDLLKFPSEDKKKTLGQTLKALQR